MIFAAIAGWASEGEYPVVFMCEQLGVSESGYYAWRNRPASARDRSDATLTSLIVAIFDRLKKNPGRRRVRAELAAAGFRVSLKRVHRFMQAADLQGRHPRAWKRTTVHDQRPVPAPDLLRQDFSGSSGTRVWYPGAERGWRVGRQVGVEVF